MTNGLQLELKGKTVSLPYIDMTRALMLHFGIKNNFKNNVIEVAPASYQAKPFFG